MTAESNAPESASNGNDFFAKLEDETTETSVNQETPAKETPLPEESPEVDWENDDNPYKKRYADSTREGQRLAEQAKELEPYAPLIATLKEDSGLVEHVTSYLENGGKPQETIKEQLKLDDDFVYDGDEAFNDPESDSAKLLNAHVDKVTKSRIDQTMAELHQKNAQAAREKEQFDEIKAFKDRHNMSEEDFESFAQQGKTHIFTLDDMYTIINKDKIAQNAQNQTQKSMLNQMTNVRNMPNSQGDVNAQNVEATSEDALFDKMFGLSNDSGNGLFG